MDATHLATRLQTNFANIEYELKHWFSNCSPQTIASSGNLIESHILGPHPKWTESETPVPWSGEPWALMLPLLQVEGGAGPIGGCVGAVPLYPTSSQFRQSRMILCIMFKQVCLPKAPWENNIYPNFLHRGKALSEAQRT